MGQFTFMFAFLLLASLPASKEIRIHHTGAKLECQWFIATLNMRMQMRKLLYHRETKYAANFYTRCFFSVLHLWEHNLNFWLALKIINYYGILLKYLHRPSHQRCYHKIVHVKGQLHLTEPSRWFYKLAKDQITHSFVSHSLTAIRYPKTKKEAKILERLGRLVCCWIFFQDSRN